MQTVWYGMVWYGIVWIALVEDIVRVTELGYLFHISLLYQHCDTQFVAHAAVQYTTCCNITML